MLTIESGGILSVDELTISGNQEDSVNCDGSSGTFTDNQVMDNGRYGSYLNASSLTLAAAVVLWVPWIRRKNEFSGVSGLNRGSPR